MEVDRGRVHADRSDAREGGTPRGPDPEAGVADPRLRDMSGDAITWSQASTMLPSRHSECSLSVFRNVLRNQTAHRDLLQALQLGGSDGSDIRFPDWPKILRLYGLRTGDPDEVIIQFPLETLPDVDLLSEARLMILATTNTNANHVVLYSREYPGFLLYDNDSSQRLRGQCSRVQSEHMPTRGHATATTRRGSHLHRAALEGEARRRARSATEDARRRAAAMECSD